MNTIPVLVFFAIPGTESGLIDLATSLQLASEAFANVRARVNYGLSRSMSSMTLPTQARY